MVSLNGVPCSVRHVPELMPLILGGGEGAVAFCIFGLGQSDVENAPCHSDDHALHFAAAAHADSCWLAFSGQLSGKTNWACNGLIFPLKLHAA